jgi:hypothetical protein
MTIQATVQNRNVASLGQAIRARGAQAAQAPSAPQAGTAAHRQADSYQASRQHGDRHANALQQAERKKLSPEEMAEKFKALKAKDAAGDKDVKKPEDFTCVKKKLEALPTIK